MSERRRDTMRSVRRGTGLGLVMVVLVWQLGGIGLARAQEATPGVPRPAECVVEPRALPLLTETTTTAATPAPLATPRPFTPPAGEPADEETVRAVTATVRQAVACRNASDFRRVYALMTDRMLRALFGGPETLDPIIVAAIEMGPRNVPRDLRLGVVSVTDVERLSDGRVGAIVTTRDATTTYVDYLFFADGDNAWRIDEQIAISG